MPKVAAAGAGMFAHAQDGMAALRLAMAPGGSRSPDVRPGGLVPTR